MTPTDAAGHLRAAAESWAPFDQLTAGTFRVLCAAMLAGAEGLEEVPRLRQQLADLETYTGNLIEAAQGYLADFESWGEHEVAKARLHDALAVPPPERGRTIHAEVERLRKVAEYADALMNPPSILREHAERGLRDALRALGPPSTRRRDGSP